ncbi:MFS transporter [Saccharophagus sp. K07]|uniref:MFS transporter n=1 Tax=Saccharophagus sp. K07 TaxID=2283636 RepID=UPI00351CA5EF
MSSGRPISEVRVTVTLALLYVFRMLGLFMVFPVMMIFGSEYEGATPFLLGLALGGYGLTQAIFQVPLGLLSDIWGRKPVIYLGFAIFMVGSIVAASTDSIWGLVIGRALQGAGAIAGAVMALVGDLTSEQNRTRAMAVIGASIGLSFSVAMILGPLLASMGGLPTVFWTSACLAFIGIAILRLLVPDPPAGRKAGSDGLAVPTLLEKAVRNRELMRLNVGVFALHFALTAMFVVVPLVLDDAGVGTRQHWHYYLPVMMIAFVLMLPFMYVAERRRKIKTVFIGAVALLGLAEVFLVYVHSLEYWLLGLLIFFTGFNLLEAMLPSLVSKMAPAGNKGTAMGIFSTSQFLGAASGGVIGGLCYQNWGFDSVLIAALCVNIVWLIMAVGMRAPRYLTSVCVPLEHDVPVEAIQNAVPGVVEALWVKEQALLYLKVDDQFFQKSELNAFLQKAAVP